MYLIQWCRCSITRLPKWKPTVRLYRTQRTKYDLHIWIVFVSVLVFIHTIKTIMNLIALVLCTVCSHSLIQIVIDSCVSVCACVYHGNASPSYQFTYLKRRRQRKQFMPEEKAMDATVNNAGMSFGIKQSSAAIENIKIKW